MTKRAKVTGGKAPPADVLVIFGIKGDLARVMTFHSLYRLEQRGLLWVQVCAACCQQDWQDALADEP